MAKPTQMFSQLRNLYSGLSLGKKISFAIFMVLGLAVFLGVVYFARQPEYRVLYSNLPAEDLSAVVGRLKDQKVPYKIGGGGDSVSVPDKNYYEVKMNLASAGLPHGGSAGFELFDQKTMGMTEFQQHLNFLRAMQGELERTITRLAAVESCRVHLAIPKESLFKEDQKEPTASVIVKFKPNARLTDEEIEGITSLVAGSVEGMEPGSVMILDSRGRLLSKKKKDDVAGPVNSAMIDYQRRLEMGLETRIIELLSRIVGPEKVSAKVNAVLDLRQVSKVEESYNPDNQVVRSEQTKNEDNTGTEQSAAAAPGIEANLPQGAAGSGSNSSNQAKKKTETVNYEIGKITSQINEPVGEIKKLSIAVLVDGNYKVETGKDGKETRTYEERTPEDIVKLTSLVKNAIGFNETRGDQLVVQNIQFNPSFDMPESAPKGLGADTVRTIANYILYGVLALLAAFMGVRLVRFLTAEPSYQAMGELAGLLPSRVSELEEKLAGPSRRLTAGEAVQEAEVVEEDTHQRLTEMREKMKTNLAKDDRAVTLMVRKWLKEQKAD